VESKYVAGVFIAVILAVAIVAAAFLLRSRPEPVSSFGQDYQTAIADAKDRDAQREAACYEGGGRWLDYTPLVTGDGTCV
jgi:hypothetical protein